MKPEDIPDSAMMLAEAVNDEIFHIAHDEVHVLGHTERKAAIARAIMAAEKRSEERAMNAAAEFLHLGTDLSITDTETLSAGIAAAIRNRSKP